MSDITSQLQLPEAHLERIEQGDNEITLHFSKVFLRQEMEGAFEDSLWTQAMNLTLKGIEIDGDLPDCPCEIEGGDFINNIYTYRNQAPLPVDWRGDVGCTLTPVGGQPGFSIHGSAMQLEQIGHPSYLRHVKK